MAQSSASDLNSHFCSTAIVNDSAVISSSFHHTPLSFYSLLSMSPAHPVLSSLQLSIFTQLSFNPLSPSFFLSTYLLMHFQLLPSLSPLSHPTFTLWSPLSFLFFPPLSSRPFRASLLIIPVPPRQCVLITQRQLHTWTEEDESKV